MDEPLCAYCQTSGQLTREHLFPAGLHRRLRRVNNQSETAIWLARLQRLLPSEPQIKDVCATCNNVILSELDSYICHLFDTQMSRILQRHETIVFKHDYHLLKRWLLKMCFNSARIHRSIDLFALQPIIPYILGKNDRLGRSVQLFLQLCYPEEIPQEDIQSEGPIKSPFILEPDINRVGFASLRFQGIGAKTLRAVHLRSFSFFLAFWPITSSLKERIYFAEIVEERLRGTKLLRKGEPEVELECNGMGAWTSFKHSRTSIRAELDPNQKSDLST